MKHITPLAVDLSTPTRDFKAGATVRTSSFVYGKWDNLYYAYGTVNLFSCLGSD